MANSLKFKRTTVDKVQIKGMLSEDGTSIFYEDDNKEEQEITVAELLNSFVNMPIEMAITLKTEQDLLDTLTDEIDE